MKKSIALVFGALFLFATANAAVTVKQNGKTAKYENGSVITVTGDADTTVNYNGVKIFVPKGVQLTVGQAANGSVTVSGTNLSGVKVGNTTVNAAGPASFSVQPKTQVISVSQGALQVQDASGNTAVVGAGSSVSAKSLASSGADNGSSVPAFVAGEVTTSTASQQAVQNVQESEVLSPSAPRI